MQRRINGLLEVKTELDTYNFNWLIAQFSIE